MKKLLFSVLSLLLLLGSCSQNEWEERTLSNGKYTVVATIEGQNNSRLTVEHNQTTNVFNLNWSDGDSFKVFDDGEGVVYTWVDGNEFGSNSELPSNPTYAIYPYATTNEPIISGTELTMTLNAAPQVSNINLPMWAGAPTNNNYAFKHLAAALEFTLNDIPAGYNQLIVTASNAISGEFKADLNESEPKLETVATTPTEAMKIVTVSFNAVTENTQNKKFYIPLPAGNYASLVVSVSKSGSNTQELKSWTNLDVERGKMYYTSAKMDAATIDDVNATLENIGEIPTTVNLTAAIDASAGAIEIPEAAKDVKMNFVEAPVTSATAPLAINQNADATSGVATSQLNVTMPVDATDLHATIDAPTTTVSLNGGSYSKVTATTATNTLIIGSDVTIEELVINGGNVIIEDEATVTKITNLVTGNSVTRKVTTAEGLKAAVAAGGNVVLDEDIVVSEIVTLGNEITLDGAGHTLTSSANRAINVDCNDSVTIKNLTIATTNNTERAINVINQSATLTLDSVTAEGFKYTINVALSSENSQITINGGKFSGYAAINITGKKTSVTANYTELIGVNDVPLGETNNFAVIAVGHHGGTTEGVSININGSKLQANSTTGNSQAAVQLLKVVDVEVIVDAELNLCDNDNVLSTDSYENVTVKFRDDYVEQLEAQGCIVSESDAKGLVSISFPVVLLDTLRME